MHMHPISGKLVNAVHCMKTNHSMDCKAATVVDTGPVSDGREKNQIKCTQKEEKLLLLLLVQEYQRSHGHGHHTCQPHSRDAVTGLRCTAMLICC